MSDTPFSFHIRRDNPYEPIVTVRFEVAEGTGYIGLRVPDRDEPAPAPQGQETDLGADVLRAGRFVHVNGGSRHSYALSRMTQQAVDTLPDGRWVTLDAVTEYGFRYLQLPADLAEQTRAPAREPVKTESFGAVTSEVPAPTANSRPTALSSPPSSGAVAVAPRQVPVAPALAESALAGLTLEQARACLLTEMAKVAALHEHAASLERELAASRAREADLLEILGRWQSR